MLRRIEIQPGLCYSCRIWRRCLRLHANEVDDNLRPANLHKHRLQKLAIGLLQPLAKEPGRYPDHHVVAFHAFLACGPEPGGETVGIYAPLHVLEDLIPKIHQK